MKIISTTFLAFGLLATSAAFADDKAGKTTEEAAKTGGNAVVDGAKTAGRTTRDFVKGGSDSASVTAKKNAKHTSEHAKSGGRKTKAASEDK